MILLLAGCSSARKEEVQAEKTQVKRLLLDFYGRDYPIVLSPFTNQSRGTNFAYLTEAIPETVSLILQSMENEDVVIDGMEYVRLRGFPVALEEKILSYRLPSWESYKVLTPQMVTQIQTQIVTNQSRLQTNVLTNTRTTNVFRFDTNTYEAFLKKEFPDLLTEVSRLPISWRVEKIKPPVTNTSVVPVAETPVSLPDWTYEGRISGRFSVRENRMGPSEVEITMVLVKIKARVTNQAEIVIRTTEDRVYEEIIKKQGEIRRFYLEGDLVDVTLDSDPQEASVYFDQKYIGRTPLVYQGVRPGPHGVQFVKEGFETAYYRVEVLPGGTNLVRGSLQAVNTTGILTLTGESNRLVFLDSLYVGVTPLVISNVALLAPHELLIRSDDRNYEDVSYALTLTPNKPSVVIPVGKGRPVAEKERARALAWGMCYGSWGITIGFMVAHFYVSAVKHTYEDQLARPQLTDAERDAYASEVQLYGEWQNRLFSYGILSSLVSMGVTAYALSQEEISVVYDPGTQGLGLSYSHRF